MCRGTTLYYNPQGTNAGSFTVTATSTDTQSTVDQIAFPDRLRRRRATHTGGPYAHAYTWIATDTAGGDKTVTATNAAGSSSTATFTVAADTTAPTGQTVDLTGGPWYTTLSVPLALRLGHGRRLGTRHHHRDRRTRQRAALERHLRHLHRRLDTRHPHRRRRHHRPERHLLPLPPRGHRQRRKRGDQRDQHHGERRHKRAHRACAHARRVLARTRTPTAPPSTTTRQGTNTGSFAVAATTTDAQSGIDQRRLPGRQRHDGRRKRQHRPLRHHLHLGQQQHRLRATKPSPPPTTPASPRPPPSPSPPIQPRPPARASSSPAAPGTRTTSVPLAIDAGSDTGSGLDLSTETVERDSAPLTDGTCDAFGGNWTTVALTGGADTTVQNGTCYRYRVTLTDRVGNTGNPSPASATARIDTTAPSAPALTLDESSAALTPTAPPSTTTRRAPTPAASPSPPPRPTASPASTASPSRPCSAATAPTDTASPYTTVYDWTATDTASRRRDRHRHQRKPA